MVSLLSSRFKREWIPSVVLPDIICVAQVYWFIVPRSLPCTYCLTTSTARSWLTLHGSHLLISLNYFGELLPIYSLTTTDGIGHSGHNSLHTLYILVECIAIRCRRSLWILRAPDIIWTYYLVLVYCGFVDQRLLFPHVQVVNNTPAGVSGPHLSRCRSDITAILQSVMTLLYNFDQFVTPLWLWHAWRNFLFVTLSGSLWHGSGAALCLAILAVF